MHTIYKKIPLTFCTIAMIACFSMSLMFAPSTVRAQGVETATNFDFHNIMSNLKSFSLDWLATTLAKQILHQMTISTINWINSGFNGSPAFLTNPSGFFLDVGDQVTGEFLSTRGTLSKLCSPWRVDIRLALALGQTIPASQRYTCTLGTIVNNARGTIEGFTGGDFSQGGWPAFISLTIEPQNNIYGSYLQAHSELLGLIGAKKDAINLDLDRGHGFLSWEKCTNVSAETVQDTVDSLGIDASNLNAGYTQKQGRLNTGNGTSYTSKVDANGNLQYQDCHTETPGSVIAGSLQKAIDSPVVEGELAQDINGVLNALVSQMISKMLTGGLASLSGGGSGGRTSYTQQVINDIDTQNTRDSRINNTQLSNTFDSAIRSFTDYKTIYDQAVSLISGNRDQYAGARACLIAKINDPQIHTSNDNRAQQYVSDINFILATEVDPLLTRLTMIQASTSEQITQINNLKTQASQTGAQQGAQFGGVRSQIPLYESAVNGSLNAQMISPKDIANAQKELKTVQAQSQQFTANAAAYNQACATYPNMSNVQGLNLRH